MHQSEEQKGSAYKAIQVEASIIEVDVGIGSLAEPRQSATRVVDEREGVHDYKEVNQQISENENQMIRWGWGFCIRFTDSKYRSG